MLIEAKKALDLIPRYRLHTPGMIQSGRALATILLLSLTSLAQGSTDFTGTWTFDSARSKNIGMMSEMRLTTVVGQSTYELTQKVDATMMGQNQKTGHQ